MAGRVLLAAVACLLVAGLPPALGRDFGPWITGRSTYFGMDAWTIHKGSCGYGYLDRGVGTGWDVAAIANVAPDFKGSCGQCKEVKCKGMNFADGYGQWLERTNVCFNDYASVVVTIVDACDCVYPNNAFSNKRWCCGDMYHIDLSMWAYEKLSQAKWGVIGIQLRDVPCWYRPRNQAKVPSWAKATPAPYWYAPPNGWKSIMDKRLDAGSVDHNHEGQRANLSKGRRLQELHALQTGKE